MHAEMAAVKAATAAYHDVSKAIADGYLAPSAAACVASPAGAMGVHSANPALGSDTIVDPLRPEVLLYQPTRGGGFRLVGVEYVVPLLLRNSTTGTVAPWFSLSPWPSGYTVVNAAPTLFGQTFHGFMAGHEPGMPWHYDLHFWAWAPNPDGDFADFNPRVSCSDGP